jgi:hypothetical protein
MALNSAFEGLTQKSAVLFFLDRFSNYIGIKFYEMNPVGGELFQENRQTDR